jgi:hypothetical protein
VEPRRIDLEDRTDRWRYRCPNGHQDWARTNSHIWCRTCARQDGQGDDLDPEHYELVDQKTGESVPWSAIDVI